MIRLSALLAAAALTASSSNHSLRRESPPSDGELPKQVVDHLKAQARKRQQQDAAIIKQMPVDYRDCALPVLVDLFMRRAAPERGYHLYVKVFDHDMDTYLQAALARYGITAYPYSTMPKWGAEWGIRPSERPFHAVDPRHTPYWGFSLGGITAKSAGRYSVGAGYVCGSLCGGSFLYDLKIDGNLCAITSFRVEGHF